MTHRLVGQQVFTKTLPIDINKDFIGNRITIRINFIEDRKLRVRIGLEFALKIAQFESLRD